MDPEKVIGGMKHCGVGIRNKNCTGCPYCLEMNCDVVMHHDALVLLQEQVEEITRLRKQLDEAMLWR